MQVSFFFNQSYNGSDSALKTPPSFNCHQMKRSIFKSTELYFGIYKKFEPHFKKIFRLRNDFFQPPTKAPLSSGLNTLILW